MDRFEDDEDGTLDGKRSNVWKQTVGGRGGDSRAPVLVLGRTQV